jgi:hypothetical protein
MSTCKPQRFARDADVPRGLLEAISENWQLLMPMMFSQAFIDGICGSALAFFSRLVQNFR